MKRVVVTGMGMVSPLGNSVQSSWEAAIAGKSGIDLVKSVDLINCPVKIGAEVKDFDPSLWMDERESRRSQKFIQFAVASARMALKDAGIDTCGQETGVSMGVGVGGLPFLEEQIHTIYTDGRGPRFVSPFTIPYFIPNMAAGMVSIALGAKGPNMCPTTACASGTHAIGEALMLIQTGRASVMVAGGSEAALSLTSFAGFSKMKALTSEFNDCPQRASRPFDRDRSGFVMGEGAGVLILEEYEHAKARNARIYAECVGYGLSGDASHITAPPESGEGAIRAMEQALQTGGLNPTDVDYINAHGTSTPINDAVETTAIKSLFQDHAHKVAISSTKSMTGHLLGAAGGVEAVFAILAIHRGIVPPTINLENPGVGCDLDYTANHARERKINVAISNSFGFGGTNGCVAFKRLG